MDLLVPMTGEDDYVDFRENLTDKGSIKPAIEQNEGVRHKEARLKDTFESWWQQRGTHITQLSGNGQQLSALRDDLIGTFTEALGPIGMLDRFAVRGIIAGFWDQNKTSSAPCRPVVLWAWWMPGAPVSSHCWKTIRIRPTRWTTNW